VNQIKFYGIGGQGVVTAAKILSIAVSIYEDEYAITIPSYGHERRGAAVYTDIVIDKEQIKMNCCVYEPDIVVVLDDTISNKNVNVANGINKDTILVINTGDKKVAEKYHKLGFKKTFWVDATQIAIDNIGLNIPNGSILGALSKTGVAPIDSIEKAIIDFWGTKAGTKNASAAKVAYERTEEI